MDKRTGTRIEIHRSQKDRQYYFTLYSRNGRKIAQSEGYKRLTGARQGISAVLDCVVEVSANNLIYGADGQEVNV